MQYNNLVLDKRSVLILPLYNNKNEIPQLNKNSFYSKPYGNQIRMYISVNVLRSLGESGEVGVGKYLGPVGTKIQLATEDDNAFDTTLLDVTSKFPLLSMIESNVLIETNIRAMLVNETRIITTLTILVNDEALKVIAGDALLSLEKKDRVYLEQFGDFANQLITTYDLYEAIKSCFDHETQAAVVALTKSMEKHINLIDKIIFEAFGAKKALPAIIETKLPS
ncbi:MAG: hypothetical protein VYA60_04750 [Pseudomonadota bacterium]|nr:hypothetical protein [Pseudomonadota bacterium]